MWREMGETRWWRMLWRWEGKGNIEDRKWDQEAFKRREQ